MGMKTSKRESNIARFEENERQGRIRAGTDRIANIFDGNFNDAFFKGRRDAYTAYATPQLEDQYADAQKELTYSLDRSGLLDSSTRAEKVGELQKLYDTNKQNIADQGLNHENESRAAVEGARSDLVQTLNVTGDAQGAANSAINRATALSAPQTFNPLSQLFAAFTTGLGQQAAQERAESMSGVNASGEPNYKARYNTGLFGTPSSSVQVK
ncbi:hypothetical protein ACQKLX_10030 [Bosea sp. NPDC003192]|uniref:hypothetical protein n=1 Tax=Bosea sp. NPDC003192 TaxID=3390551 RepID=UPI003CFFECD0